MELHQAEYAFLCKETQGYDTKYATISSHSSDCSEGKLICGTFDSRGILPSSVGHRIKLPEQRTHNLHEHYLLGSARARTNTLCDSLEET